ncbi:MAG: hypothetical protein CMC05_07445 [Flavobacteriaceae bacterium]|nr:hypothetical protein [Flavobacteriaceae bacterium]MBD10937.1 hypothetical protein [Flavobacteriaceae bacterium]|tara:strand:+ start:1966 stop:2211 length:246 start_codon:yes stop_codon:yes gene_type:complete
MKPIHIVTLIAFITSVVSIVCGLVLDTNYTEKLIGFGVLGLFFVVFPLFSYYRWKGKDAKDYMLTKENLEKMRENQRENKY